jgi:hypothetical protein
MVIQGSCSLRKLGQEKVREEVNPIANLQFDQLKIFTLRQKEEIILPSKMIELQNQTYFKQIPMKKPVLTNAKLGSTVIESAPPMT